ncbi:MAG: IclR family transcriptional regulator [Bacillota bacterium]
MSGTKGTLRIVDRVFDVLECFSEERREWGVTQLAQHLDLHKSVVQRILTSLAARGYLRCDPKTRRYTLGLRFLDISTVALEGIDLRDIALPYMRELVRATDETGLLTIVDGDEGVCIGKVESTQGVKCTSFVGKRMPLHAGAVTKVLMAYLPEHQVERIIARGLKRFTQYTVTDPITLRAQLEEVRRQGYCITEQEVDPGSVAVAAPIRDHTGEVVAGLSLSAPMFRVTAETLQRIIPLVVETAERISGALGSRGRP